MEIGATRFELATSTSRTKWHSDENTVKDGAKSSAAERLHQCLHQIDQADPLEQVSYITTTMVESLSKEVLQSIVDSIPVPRA